jgi:glyoxylase-like metal-dependent hydrolase (beta-lactamase superfamily II)
MPKLSISIFALLFLLSCTNARRGTLVQRDFLPTPKVFSRENATHQVTVSYTGCGGYWIDYEGKIILLDPFFSNFSIPTLLTKKLKSDTATIDCYFQKRLGIKKDTAGRVAAILISHAHYDHLSDVPSLLQRNLKPSSITFFANQNTCNLLLPFRIPTLDTAQFMNIEQPFENDYVVHQNKPFETRKLENTRNYTIKSLKNVRITPIPSEHAGHFKVLGKPFKAPFLEGTVKENKPEIPRKSTDFKEGKNFNYCIDFLADDGITILFRIFANNGAGCNEGIGFLPETLLVQKKVDLLLLCGANYDTAKNYPDALLDYTQPNYIFINHWENFFKSISTLQRKLETVPAANIPKLLHHLNTKKTAPEHLILTLPLEEGVTFGF